MIIYSWNIRGLNNPLKQHEVVSLMKKQKMDICGLLETKLLPSKVSSLHKFRLRHWQFFSNADVAHTARIVVFWNPNTVQVDLLASSPQAIHLSVTCLISQISFMVTFVYGFNTISAR
jgi:exonuclease III